MRSRRSITVGLIALMILIAVSARTGWAAPEGELRWAVHVSLAPTWFDPAETPGIITPYMVMYAIHDALAKPMPGQAMAPSLAAAWTVSPDGRSYEFALRKGIRFHNGQPVTADDVKFSFERYHGSAAKTPKARVAAVDVLDASHLRFRLKNPWPDFLLFYTSASGAGWIVPRKYVEKVGDEGFKQAPVGAGAGEYFCDSSYANLGEAVVANLEQVGVKVQLRPQERAAFFGGYGGKRFRNLIQGASGAFGNTATRLEAFVISGGTYVYGAYPDLDGLYREQASELDPKKREAILHRLQQLLSEKVVYAPIWELAFLNGVGPRVEESGLGLIAGHAYSAPYEDLRIKQ